MYNRCVIGTLVDCPDCGGSGEEIWEVKYVIKAPGFSGAFFMSKLCKNSMEWCLQYIEVNIP